MKIENTTSGFVETIEKAGIERIECNYNGICTVHFYDRQPRALSVGCSFFNSQYGIPVSQDGTRLFVGSWEAGLCAYDIFSGTLIWRHKPGKIRNILVYPSFLIVSRAYTSIVKIDIQTGKVLAEIRSGTLEHIFDLGAPYIFADTISGKHCIIDTEKMIVVKKYASKVVNPSDCLSLIVRNAVLQDNVITISGLEKYPQKNLDAKILIGGTPFSRVIDPNFITCEA